MTHIAPFIATFTGGKAYPLGLDPADIKIEDIAHALSQQCRYAGHTSHFWSVAAHSLEVSRRVEAVMVEQCTRNAECGGPSNRAYARLDMFFGTDDVRLAALTALLHDASEAYLTDIVKPIKPLLQGYAAWEENAEAAIAERFGLIFPFPAIVKAADNDLVKTEVANFFPQYSAAWRRYGIERRADFDRLEPLTPPQAETAFLIRFEELF